MIPEDAFLFLAAHQRLTEDQQRRLAAAADAHPLQWQVIFRTAEENGVAPLVYHNVSCIPTLEAQIPQALKDHYRLYTLQNAVKKKARFQFLNQALHFLHDRSIPVIVFKGASLDLLVYDQPWYTSYSDTDLILGVKSDALSTGLRQEIGDLFYLRQVEYDYYEHHDFTMNGMLPVDFAAVWKAAWPASFGNAEALVLSPEDQLLSLCINSCRKRFFRLKSLLDICETVAKYPGFDWDAFVRRCRGFSCGNIVYAALYVAAALMDLRVSGQVLEALEPSAVRRAFIRTNVGLITRFWSLSLTTQQSRLFNRLVDTRLILPYTVYRPRQIFHKVLEIRRAAASEKK